MHVKKKEEEAYAETCMSETKKNEENTKLILRHACLTKNKNDHIYKNYHNWDRKFVSRHDFGGIRKEIR